MTLRFDRGAPCGGFGFRRRDAREIEDHTLERRARIAARERRFERREAHVELRAQRVELLLSCGGEVIPERLLG